MDKRARFTAAVTLRFTAAPQVEFFTVADSILPSALAEIATSTEQDAFTSPSSNCTFGDLIQLTPLPILTVLGVGGAGGAGGAGGGETGAGGFGSTRTTLVSDTTVETTGVGGTFLTASTVGFGASFFFHLFYFFHFFRWRW